MVVRVLRLAAAAVVLLAGAPCAAADPPDPPVTPTEPARLAITPAWAHSFAPRSVSSEGIGLVVDLFPSRIARGRLGLSLAGSLYGPFSTERPPRPASGSPRLLSETLGFVAVELRVLAVKTSAVELHALAGNGAVGTRPTSIVDPTRRHFDHQPRLAFSLGVGLRVALARNVLLSVEGRHVVFVDQHEAESIAPRRPENPDTWFGEKPVVNMIEGRIGLTFVLFPEPS